MTVMALLYFLKLTLIMPIAMMMVTVAMMTTWTLHASLSFHLHLFFPMYVELFGVDIVLVYLLVLLSELYPPLFMHYLMFRQLLTYLNVAVRMTECQCGNIQPITSCNAALKLPLCIWVDVFSKNG